MKNLSIKNFSLQNTPALAQKIGNICLLLAAVGTAIIGMPATLEAAGIPGFVLPHFLAVTAKAFIAIGIFSKVFTKLLGDAEVK